MAEVTNHNVNYVYRKIPYARGLQYQSIWAQWEGIELQRPKKTASLVRIL